MLGKVSIPRPVPSAVFGRARLPLPCRVLLGIVLLALAACPQAFGAEAFSLGVRFDVPVGDNPQGFAVADLNADGLLDLIVPNRSANTVSVLLGTGGGAFGTKTDYATGSLPGSAAVGDLNGDGFPDVVTGNAGGNSISAFLGNGSGGLGPRTNYTAGGSPGFVALGDLNGDGRLDAVSVNNSTSSVSVFLGNGAGGFGAKTDFSVGSSPTTCVLVDLNGDGKLDVATSDWASGFNMVTVLTGDGKGGLGSRNDIATGSMPFSIAAGDVNRDGLPDLVTADYASAQVSVLLNNGSGGFLTHVEYAAGDHPGTVAIGDVTGDGVADLVVGNQFGGSVSVLVGTGSGTFGAKTDFGVGASPTGLAIADVNGDGAVDLVLANGGDDDLSVLLAAGRGVFGTRTNFGVAGYPGGIVAGDLDGDGSVDLAAVASGNPGIAFVLPGTGSGGFGPVRVSATGAYPRTPGLGDLNRDGRLDLVTVNHVTNLASVGLGTGTGGFGANTDFPAGGEAMGCALGDLNNDGLLDLAVVNYLASGYVSILLGTGTGGFGAKTDFTTLAWPYDVAIGDFNSDGLADLAVLGGSTSGGVSVLLGTGSGGFGAKTDFATGVEGVAVTVGDLNGDGRPDLVVANYYANTISVLLGTGTGTFGAKSDYATGQSPADVALGDVNGDGRPDAVIPCWSSNAVCVLLGDGAGGFGPAGYSTTGMSPAAAALCDLDADGRLDVATVDANGNDVSVLLRRTPTRLALTTSADPVVLGQPLTLTASVTVPVPGSGTPGDSVRFFDGTTLLGTSPVVGGTAGLALFAPRIGARTLTAVYRGDTRFSGAVSAPRIQQVVATAAPVITSIRDVASDEGGQVRLRFRRSPFDVLGSGTPITQYEVFRQVNPALAAALASVARASDFARVARAGEVLKDGWDLVATAAADADSAYSVVVPTLVDSSDSGLHRAVFLVRAKTGKPGVYYESAPDSGYSVDNRAPAVPAPFRAAYVSGATHLHWGANSEADFAYYRIYRGSSAGFTAGPASLIASRSDTGYVDTGSPGGYYKLSAVDVSGNESGYAVLGPDATTDVGESRPVAFALESVRPNPASAGRLEVAFALPSAASARIELLDVGGRRVAGLEVGALGPGRHSVDLAAGTHLPPGLYLVRLSCGSERRVRRVTVLE